MVNAELADLETLLYQVLPDPKGYAERVFQQLRDRLVGYSDVTQQSTVIASNDEDALEALQDRNLLVAAALGACDCWGENPECLNCSGQGVSGWTMPDRRLYREIVEPATNRVQAFERMADDRAKNQPTLKGEPR